MDLTEGAIKQGEEIPLKGDFIDEKKPFQVSEKLEILNVSNVFRNLA